MEIELLGSATHPAPNEVVIYGFRLTPRIREDGCDRHGFDLPMRRHQRHGGGLDARAEGYDGQRGHLTLLAPDTVPAPSR